ncbi:MAG: oligosaccharide flippase family protein, partial [Alphaproteobacteria bacterium]
MREAVLPALRWTALGRLGAQALSLAATLVVVRILGPSEYGLFALCMTLGTFLGALVVVAPSSLVIRGNAPRRDTRRATGLLVALAGLATLAMVPASVAIAWSQDDPRTLPLCLALVACVLWPHAISAAWQASFERRLDRRAGPKVELAAGRASPEATLGCALAGPGAWALAAGAAAASATQFLLLLAALRGDALPSFDFGGLGRADAAYGGRVVLGTLATQALEAAETFLLARFLGAPELGAWRTTRELVNVPMGKVMPIVN